MRLIDANKLRVLFNEEFKRTKQLIVEGETHLDTLAEGYAEAWHIVNYRALSVDAVPVVRCQDCKWDRPDILLDKHWCSRFCGSMEIRGDDFCSYGARREDKP